MKPSEKEKLLRELLPDEDLAGFREASLERGLASMRRHRRQHVWLRAGGLATLAGLLLLGLLLKEHQPARNNTNTVAVSSPAASVSSPEPVKFISDDELLAMFPKGSVALIGKPGRQRLVFLDKVQADTAQGPY